MRLLRTLAAVLLLGAAASACSAPPTAPAESAIPLPARQPIAAPSLEDDPIPPLPTRQPTVGPKFEDEPAPPKPRLQP